jgi:hypothetical protein
MKYTYSTGGYFAQDNTGKIHWVGAEAPEALIAETGFEKIFSLTGHWHNMEDRDFVDGSAEVTI